MRRTKRIVFLSRYQCPFRQTCGSVYTERPKGFPFVENLQSWRFILTRIKPRRLHPCVTPPALLAARSSESRGIDRRSKAPAGAAGGGPPDSKRVAPPGGRALGRTASAP